MQHNTRHERASTTPSDFFHGFMVNHATLFQAVEKESHTLRPPAYDLRRDNPFLGIEPLRQHPQGWQAGYTSGP